MITAERLSKNFGPIQAIREVSFQVEKGEILGFLGPNAAGKSTTMKILTCYFPPTSGRASVAGFDVLEESMQVRRNIGYLPENVPLYPEMTVREYLEFVAAAKGVHHVDRKAAVDRAIERCNLEEVEDQLVATISRGFKQRTGLAQAVLNEPPVLILDEPTVGLDPAQIREIRELIRELGRKSTIVLSTHILPEVEVTCNRVIIISRGRIRAMDTPQNLAATLREKTILGLQVQGPPDQVREALRRVEGVKAVDLREVRDQVATFRVETDPRRDLRPELARLIVSRDWPLLELVTEHLSLEEVFLEVVQREDELDQQERQESPQAVEAVSGGEKA